MVNFAIPFGKLLNNQLQKVNWAKAAKSGQTLPVLFTIPMQVNQMNMKYLSMLNASFLESQQAPVGFFAGIMSQMGLLDLTIEHTDMVSERNLG